jgi:hypothetical protein
MVKSSQEVDKLLITSLADVIKPRGAIDGSNEEMLRISRIPDRKGLLAESILFADQIVFDISGPNLELPLLLKIFGQKSLIELLEEKVIRFLFSPGTFAYISSENKESLHLSGDPGLSVLMGQERAWYDPFESAILGLTEQSTLSRKDRREIAILATRNTDSILDNGRVLSEAQRLADADLKTSLGLELGFTNTDNPGEGMFNEKKRRLYLDLASHNLSYLNMSLSGCNDLVAEPLAYKVLHNRVIPQSQILQQRKIIDTLFSFENVSNIRSLVAMGSLSMQKILKLRKQSSTIEFRKWLKTLPTNSTEVEVIKAYNSAIQDNISSKPAYKILKIGIFTALGSAIGGGVVGVTAALAASLTDSFIIDRLVDGWNPKIFIENDVKNRVSK